MIMKAIKYISLFAAASLMASCTLDLDKTEIGTAEINVKPVLSDIADVLSDANTTSVEKVVFTWSDADFGAKTQIEYSLYAKLGDKTALLGQSYSNRLTIGKGDLVGVICNDLEGAKNENVRIESYVEANIYGAETTESLVSNSVAYNVYTYLPPKKNIWLPGKYQGWAQFGTTVWETEAGTSQYKILVDVSNSEETPYYFKIVDEGGNWVGMNDGYAPDGWSVADPANSDGNFSVTADEPIAWLTINTKRKTVAKQTIKAVALIGAFNNWSEAEEPSFTYDAAENVWVSPVINFEAGGEWLVRLDRDWQLKFGSAVATTDIAGGYELTQGGANITAPEAGNFIVKLYTDRTPFVIVYEKQ